jgi:hypothetical protein
MVRKIFILLFIYLSNSCLQKQSQEAKNQYCANQLELITASDSLPLIPIQVNTSYDSVLVILEKLEKGNNIDDCNRLVYFGMPFALDNDSIKLRVHISRQCYGLGLSSSRAPSIKILLNAKGNRLVEEEPTNNDQYITEILRNHYFNNGVDPSLPDYPRDTFVRLEWDSEVPSDSLQRTIKAIVDGYFQVSEEFSIRVYEKKVCKMTEQEKLRSKKEFPLNLEMGFYNSPIIPPILPSLEPSEAEISNVESIKTELEVEIEN